MTSSSAAHTTDLTDNPDLTVLRAAGTALVLDTRGPDLPRVLHWGADLPDEAVRALPLLAQGPVPPSALDRPWPLTVLPTDADGWLGTPGYAAHRGGRATAPRFAVTSTTATVDSVEVVLGADGAEVTLVYRLDEHGVLTASAAVASTVEPDGPELVLDLAALRVLLPVPSRATEVLDLTGRWCRERSPQRRALTDGTHLRASRRGRTGHDATLLLSVGTPGFGFRAGEVWSVHVAWSGGHEHLVERLPEGAGMHAAVLGGGELLEPGEVRLGPGERYAAPDVVFVHSAEGLDGISRRLHRAQRATATRARRPRPLVLNTWEAVYFDHDLGRLRELADTAAAIGVERFVLDDGWFGGRRHDRAGLGDWWVSPEAWPDGLGPIVEHVKDLGMEFGLWFEPEMVNADSDLVRQHPDWVLGPRAGHPREWRHQQVLDLANPEAAAHVERQISTLVSELGIDFIKWDHNRDLHEAVRPGDEGEAGDRPAVHTQTAAFYDLLDRLRATHPGLEVESCASGGARVDLGVLARTDRVWTSDCNDALERAQIQRWTSLLVPAEVMGTHVGPPTAHTTHRSLDLGFRTLMALQGHAGLEWDITTCDASEREALTRWSALYRELRPLLHGGDLVRADLPAEEGLLVTGTVAADGAHAAYTVVRTHTGPRAVPGLVPLPGLDPEREYTVRVRPEAGLPHTVQTAPPVWWADALGDGLRLSGAVLGTVGLPLPVLAPAQGLLLHLT
ncbi:alpha-galactosidase [Pedococcus cremeus]|uniref:alpha-galactosidase n=1 Tax=Pedococcus cremeus TaxID=587636 RepID=A0A1H9X700_9MICO|nr:alpha-galactosidase [Pedococcus cremeus]SES41978.1 alpha-galactosidase [Pedococcus cremeus]